MTIYDGKIRCLKWMDKRLVNMLSTHHDASMVEKERRTKESENGVEIIQKPKMIEDYNKHMGGVDKSDQQVVYYGYPHRLVTYLVTLITCYICVEPRSGGNGCSSTCSTYP